MPIPSPPPIGTFGLAPLFFLPALPFLGSFVRPCREPPQRRPAKPSEPPRREAVTTARGIGHAFA
eukprot:14415116-Alexandrium_andersonii.AAC.1